MMLIIRTLSPPPERRVRRREIFRGKIYIIGTTMFIMRTRYITMEVTDVQITMSELGTQYTTHI